jgi:hypothetical protein
MKRAIRAREILPRGIRIQIRLYAQQDIPVDRDSSSLERQLGISEIDAVEAKETSSRESSLPRPICEDERSGWSVRDS